jgi:hypothetical protein
MSEKAVLSMFIVMLLLMASGGDSVNNLEDYNSQGENDRNEEGGSPLSDNRDYPLRDGEVSICYTLEPGTPEYREACGEEWYDCRTEEVWSDEKREWCDGYEWPIYPPIEPPQTSSIILVFIIIDEDNFSFIHVEEVLAQYTNNPSLINNIYNPPLNYTCDDDPFTDDCFEEESEIHACNLPNATNCED